MTTLPPLPPTMKRIAGASLPPDPADSPSIRWAIMGAGGIAAKFATDVLRSGSSVVAVGSRTPKKAAEFAQEHAIPFAGSYDQVLARDDVDAVYVATTHNFHRECALQAIAAGKPVLIEKPMVRNRAELDQVRAAAEAAGVLVMEAMWSRFLPHYAVIRAVDRSGIFGKVTYVRAEHIQRLRGVERMEDPALAGGATLDLGVYPASFIHWILGKPDSVQAIGHLTDRGVDADSAAVLRYPEANAVYVASMQARSDNPALITWETGRISLPYDFYRPSEIRMVWDESGESHEEVWSLQSIADYGFEYQAAAFARALSDGKTEVPGHGWDDAAEVIEILDAVRHDIGVVLPGE